ncbi:MAG: hypothetical protein NTW12_15810 [Deltaproteobacteria bacterium]|nr:hypothetical protein [Deltaproteobacteria bacterium]
MISIRERQQDGPGPRRVAEFIVGTPADEIKADVVGFVRMLLREIED